MSNDKQQIKLYTENDLIDLVQSLKDYTHESHSILGHDERDAKEFVDIFLKDRTPIELPSDEDIDRESEVLYPINKGGSMWMPSRYDIDKKNRQEGFLEGAKWMRNKIQGGNNE